MIVRELQQKTSIIAAAENRRQVLVQPADGLGARLDTKLIKLVISFIFSMFRLVITGPVISFSGSVLP